MEKTELHEILTLNRVFAVAPETVWFAWDTEIGRDTVIEANVVPTQYPAIQAGFKKYCIPWLNEYNVPGSKGIPVFQTDNKLSPTGKLSSASLIELGLGPRPAPNPPDPAEN